MVRRMDLSAISTKLQPLVSLTAISGTTETPIPAETIARIVANCPLSNTTRRNRALTAGNFWVKNAEEFGRWASATGVPHWPASSERKT